MNKKPESIKFNDFLNTFSLKEKREIELRKNKLILAMQIRELRRMKNVSSMELAKKSKVSYKTISKIENHKSVNFDSVIKVLDALGLTINYSLK